MTPNSKSLPSIYGGEDEGRRKGRGDGGRRGKEKRKWASNSHQGHNGSLGRWFVNQWLFVELGGEKWNWGYLMFKWRKSKITLINPQKWMSCIFFFFFRNWYSTGVAGCVGNRSIVIREWNNLVAQLRSDLIEKEHHCNLSPFLMLLFSFLFFLFF